MLVVVEIDVVLADVVELGLAEVEFAGDHFRWPALMCAPFR